MLPANKRSRPLRRLAILLACIPPLQSCGKSAPSPADLRRLRETLDSTARVVDVIPTTVSAAPASLAAFSSAAKPEDEPTRRMRERLTQASEAGHCRIRPDQDSFVVEGGACPIRLEAHAPRSGAWPDTRSDFQAQYEVLDAAFLELNDVRAFELNVHSESAGKADAEVTADLSIQGVIRSQKHGDIQVQGEAHSSGTDDRTLSGAGAITFKFPAATIVLGTKMSQGEATYTINGRDASEQEMRDAVGDFWGDSSGSSSGHASPPAVKR